MEWRSIWIGSLILLLAGCTAEQRFRPENLAKSDLDFIADSQLAQIDQHLQRLMQKLYRRNPRELAKTPQATIASRTQLLFDLPPPLIFDELGGRQSIDAMLLALDPGFRGDRVFALMVGLTGMLLQAYDNKSEFFLLDRLDEQKLYNSARNIEVLAWRLRTRVDVTGAPLILTNSLDPQMPNLSFERLFGQLIALQDSIAQAVAQRNQRTINRLVHGLATSFLPI
ncbi:hypothetical protein [Aestuariirhabdus litorea]|uniref:Lipoprotein n=1 Tax=Aestuariirhabdus litorea TaxID=2528527 RepID=A0A3P3VNH6_9GAMM|nr:hypothetical protein [Aestuariirhabdus litorea]RRJ82383.1 hypothetical protein D0544_10900 [Aestuariirhabdus litorea]RWW92546.1 hypothetical protein DZC74_10880 [Endozoicomonadaceae bacterium GTF-13]